LTPLTRGKAKVTGRERLVSALRFRFLTTAESISMALASLWSRRLRSFLTLLGIIIGVATVITVVSILQGMNQYVVRTLSSFGSDSFFISKFGIITSHEQFLEARRRKNISMEQMESLKDYCSLCREVGASVGRPLQVKYGRDYIDDVEVTGVTDNILVTDDYHLAEGRMFTPSDVLHKRPVCVIGNEIREILFPGRDPIDREIKVGRLRLTIIGTIDKRGTFLGQSLDNFLLMPITLYRKTYGSKQSIDIHVKARRREEMESTKDQAKFFFRAIRGLKRGDEDDFGIVTTNALVDTYNNFTGMAYLVLIGVASISLLIGGIVIMNIMLVSVTERIKEIGIRKALGAKRSDIIGQFLAESVTISTVGGLIGIIAGAAIATAVSHFSSLPSSIEPWAVIAGIIVSGGVGICFGTYPAVKAARMDPILALRQE